MKRKIALLEDHHQAYYEWKKHTFQNLPLIHLDAHIDFGFQEVKNEKTILQEARSLKELRTQLEKSLLFKKFKFNHKRLTTIANYIYPAMRDGIVNDFFWVIPGKVDRFKKSLSFIKSMIKDFRKQDPYAHNRASFEPGFIRTRLYNRSLYICTLETLPEIKRPSLLDIDVDFLVTDSLKNADPTVNIGKRKPWIFPEKLTQVLKKKIHSPQFITISYSVNGGFTPMVYKTFGDQIAKLFGSSDPELEKRILAGKYFRDFRDFFEKQRFEDAKSYYQQALKLNSKYKTSDNNYGLLYLEIEDYSRAEKEFMGILKVDKKDSYSLSGLGRINLFKKKHKEAKDCFQKALVLKPDNKAALIGLAEVEFKRKCYSSSKNILSRYEKIEPMQGYSRYLLGQIYEKEKKHREALYKYKESLQLGLNNIELLSRLVRLSNRFDKNYLDYLKKKFEDYKKYFYKSEKKILVKKHKLLRVQQIEAMIKRLNSFFEN